MQRPARRARQRVACDDSDWPAKANKRARAAKSATAQTLCRAAYTMARVVWPAESQPDALQHMHRRALRHVHRRALTSVAEHRRAAYVLPICAYAMQTWVWTRRRWHGHWRWSRPARRGSLDPGPRWQGARPSVCRSPMRGAHCAAPAGLLVSSRRSHHEGVLREAPHRPWVGRRPERRGSSLVPSSRLGKG